MLMHDHYYYYYLYTCSRLVYMYERIGERVYQVHTHTHTYYVYMHMSYVLHTYICMRYVYVCIGKVERGTVLKK